MLKKVKHIQMYVCSTIFFTLIKFSVVLQRLQLSCLKAHAPNIAALISGLILSALHSLHSTFTINSLSTMINDKSYRVVGMKSPSRDIEFQFSQRTINSAVRVRCYEKEKECKRCAHQIILFSIIITSLNCLVLQ